MKDEIKHFKSLLRQGSLRHMNILLDDKFQKELQTIIEDYEKLQQENQQLKILISAREEVYRKLEDNWNKLKKYIQDICCYDEVGLRIIDPSYLEDKIAELERSVSDVG